MRKGSKHSEEIKRHWSETRRGKNIGNTWGFKLGFSPWNKGLKTGIKPWLGKKRSEETRKKLSEAFIGKRIGEKSPVWKGNKVGYHALHGWVKRWKGEPNLCEKCGTTTSRMYHWANIDHQYRRVLDDYIRLCVPCHKVYDRELRNK